MDLWLPGVRDSEGVRESHVHTAVLKMSQQQDLLYRTWNSAQCCVPAWVGAGLGKNGYVCLCTAESLHCSPGNREAREYWSGQPIPSPADLPDPGIELGSPALQEDSLPAEPPGEPENTGAGSLSLL